MEAFEQLKQLVAQAEDEVAKVDSGNKAAGSRVRKLMMEIKGAAQDVREKVLELRQGPGEAPQAPAGNPPTA